MAGEARREAEARSKEEEEEEGRRDVSKRISHPAGGEDTRREKEERGGKRERGRK